MLDLAGFDHFGLPAAVPLTLLASINTHPWGVHGAEPENAISRFLSVSMTYDCMDAGGRATQEQLPIAIDNVDTSLYRFSGRHLWTATNLAGVRGSAFKELYR
ncbi:MAG: hypothetical protein ABFS02_12905 [Pseudomonadota bacterium]